ncbi:hypothetical protein [Kocuria carniphila]|uniref:hypothetical protein n=1 Tax=Kocuria carniphila TaxID=262208 RepID=UPI0034CE5E14
MSTETTETTHETTREPSQDSPEASGRVETLETTLKPGEERTAPEPVEPDDVSKLRKEAASHRVTAREAREELEATQGRLSAVQDALLAGELKARGVQLTPAALAAVGLRDGVFSEDNGIVDAEALDAALGRAQELGLTLRKRPAPDLTTGREVPPGGPEGGVTASSWSQVIGKK